MIQVNALIPALVAGNSVLLKPSPQTPLVAERIQESFEAVGIPRGLIQVSEGSPFPWDATWNATWGQEEGVLLLLLKAFCASISLSLSSSADLTFWTWDRCHRRCT